MMSTSPSLTPSVPPLQLRAGSDVLPAGIRGLITSAVDQYGVQATMCLAGLICVTPVAPFCRCSYGLGQVYWQETFRRPLPHYTCVSRALAPSRPCSYGLGQVCYRQEKYQDALNNFRAASAIAPRSSVLCCYVGMSAAKLHQHHLALDKLQVRPNYQLFANTNSSYRILYFCCVGMSAAKLHQHHLALDKLQVRANSWCFISITVCLYRK